MKKNIVKIIIGLVFVVAVNTAGDIEINAACNSVGWWNNNGNCVSNNAGAYFCKIDDWLSLTDCIQDTPNEQKKKQR